MEKVIAIYGGTTWEKIEGQFLLGASDTYEVNSTGGEATHTLTVSEMPSHSHTIPSGLYAGEGAGTDGNYALYAIGIYGKSSGEVGGSQPHNNMPPYKAVYIWERTA